MVDEVNRAPTGQATAVRRTQRRRRLGTVVSDKGDKSITVVVNFLMRFPKYGKFIRRRTKLHVHDVSNQAKVGDRVEIAECRPISKTKNWRLVRVVAPTKAK
jgi:small subunit ribosomal protein S17